MSLIHRRFNHTLIASIVAGRDRRKQFDRLLADRPTGVHIRTRHKNPAADLKRHRRREIYAACTGFTVAIHAALILAFPDLSSSVVPVERPEFVLQIQDIPETRQFERPKLERPSVPIETEEAHVPDDVTIESTDLDFDNVPVDLPPPPALAGPDTAPAEEDYLEFWKVEQKPKLVKRVAPDYPQEAKALGIEGTVFIKVLVGRDGRPEQVEVIKGDLVFESSAVEAASQFVFQPALQNDVPVRVWMVIPLQYRLTV